MHCQLAKTEAGDNFQDFTDKKQRGKENLKGTSLGPIENFG